MSLKEIFQDFFEAYPRWYRLLARSYLLKNHLVYHLKRPRLINKKSVCLDSVELVDHFKNSKRNYFFGYYDKSPWSSSQKYLLYLSVPRIERHPTVEDEGTIEYIDLEKGEKQKICKTRAWNWQQGCMLKWLDDSFIIYNDHRSGRYVSVKRHLHDGIEKVLPLPVYTVDQDNKQALSLNFERLHHLRPGYGYDSGRYKLEEYAPPDDGIYRVDLEDETIQLVMTLNELSEDDDRYNWVNHIEFNPSGTRAVFLHRVESSDGWRTRMFTMDPDGSNLYSLCDSGNISHFTWKNDEELLAWAKKSESDEGSHYYLFKDQTEKVDIVGGEAFDEDGHPSFSPDGKWILTDTYPDKGGWKELILYDLEHRERYDLGRFHTPIKYRLGPLKSDLHPRWDREGKKVCFDSVHEGRRKMYVMDVSNIVNQ